MKVFCNSVFILLIFVLLSNLANAYDLSEYPSPFIEDGRFNGVIAVGDNAPSGDVIALSDLILTLQYPVLGSDPESVSAFDTLTERQTKTYAISGVYYEVTLNFIKDDLAQFIVNGMTTARLSIGEGETLVDGMRITLADIFFENGRYSAFIFFGRENIKLKKTAVEMSSAKLASEIDDLKSVNSILIGHACGNPLIMKVRESDNDCRVGYEEGIGSIEAYEFPNGKVSVVVTGYSPNDTANAAQVLGMYGHFSSSFRGKKITVKKVNNERLPVISNPAISNSDNLRDNSYGKADSTKSFNENNLKIGLLIFVLLAGILLFLTLMEKSNKKIQKFK
ncbi:hypothetical protein HY637_02520 [Candidatus Woesearchaeota archaeon]|nr:hypothetical protein [Candidatus Woesearchaeota archaeon]